MTLNISIFRNIQFFLLFITQAQGKAEFYIKKVLISLHIMNHSPNFLVLHTETTSNLVGFPGVPPCTAEIFTHLQKRHERTK